MVNESLDHVSPVENQGDHLSFYSGCWWVGGWVAQWWLVRDVARTTMGTSREGGVAAQTVRLRLETEQMVRVRSVGKECVRVRACF